MFVQRFALATGVSVCSVLALGAPMTAHAGITGVEVKHGEVHIQHDRGHTVIDASDSAIINYDRFNIGAMESVHFDQPHEAARVLNRVTGSDMSTIAGTLTADGIVHLVNPNGLHVVDGAVIDVGGFHAIAGRITNEDFLAGDHFYTDLEGAIVNEGAIQANAVQLIGRHIANRGTILAQDTLTMVVGDAVYLTERQGHTMVRLSSEDAQSQAGTLEQSGEMAGQRITMEAGDMYALLLDEGSSTRGESVRMEGGDGSDVHVAGEIEASSNVTILGEHLTLEGALVDASNPHGGGEVLIGGPERGQGDGRTASTLHVDPDTRIHADAQTHGDGGRIITWADDHAHIAGTLTARGGAHGGDGGFIETSAKQIELPGTLSVRTHAPHGRTGTWLIDPTDFAIADAGGDLTPSQLADDLDANHIVIETEDVGSDAGDIFVKDDVTWTSDHTLTLRAHRHIDITAAITNTDGGSLHLRADKDGAGTGTIDFHGSGSVEMAGGGRTDLYYNPSSYNSPGDFSGDITGDYTAWMLVNDASDLAAIDDNLAGDYALGRDITEVGSFTPLAQSDRFTGRLDGLGHVITELDISAGGAGLFERTDGAILENLGLIDVDVTGSSYAGSLAVRADHTTIRNVHATGTVEGNYRTGGLVGSQRGGTIAHSHADVTVDGSGSSSDLMGGLVGYLYDDGTITGSHATGDVLGYWLVGGLVGYMSSGTLEDVYATGDVSSGGSGGDYLGGLVGYTSNATIHNAYATGDVQGYRYIGGLIGMTTSNTDIDHAYAAGSVTGSSRVGAFVGRRYNGTWAGNFWDSSVNPGLDGVDDGSESGVTGVSGADMMNPDTFADADWSIADEGGSDAAWRIYEGETRPLLRTFMTDLDVKAQVSRTYDGTAVTLDASDFAFVGFKDGEDINDLSGSFIVIGDADGAVDAGTYDAQGAGLHSDQRGYDIHFIEGQLTIDPAALDVIHAEAQNKVYDATTDATITNAQLDGIIGGDDVTLANATTGEFHQSDVGTNIAVSTTMGLAGPDAGNYALAGQPKLTADITPASLMVTDAEAQNKVYDATTDATITNAQLDGIIGGDDVALANATTGEFHQSDVGTNIAVSTNMGLAGSDAGNYTLAGQPKLTADITPASLMVTDAEAQNKVYDATTDATITNAQLDGIIGGDDVTLANATTGEFHQSDVGTNIAVSMNMGLAGSDAGNYALAGQPKLTANITPASLMVADAEAQNKVYDATTEATISNADLDGVFGDDDVTLTNGETGEFEDAFTGEGIAVHTEMGIAGDDASNYELSAQPDLAADITPRPLTIEAVDVIHKQEDGNRAVTIDADLFVLDGMVANDVVELNVPTEGEFDSSAAGMRTVTVEGFDLVNGPQTSNYMLASDTLEVAGRILRRIEQDWLEPTMPTVNAPAPQLEVNGAFSSTTSTDERSRAATDATAHELDDEVEGEPFLRPWSFINRME